MGDIEPVALPGGAQGGGAIEDGGLLQPQTVNVDPESVSAGVWFEAERATYTVMQWIKPTYASEYNRTAVVDYVQRLIRNHLGSEVFPFGSVPLKTYLPDGDIDLTTFSFLNAEDALSNNVRMILKSVELNSDAEFEVKDVQYIHAEVKLIKCLVQNIVVDISFNQIGGLCALCFLEEVDRLIGKDHLFKHSIILIKAWCYYESRILGAYHGLISTYALETLVLHIFHVFHKTLDGPLAVLYRFLDYYSKFDWDKYGVSLNGPFILDRLPEIKPIGQSDDVLLKEEFLKKCVDKFSVPLKTPENSRVFNRKFFNIVDPLKQMNNLGRSVSKGNFFRIRSAFVFGARRLSQIFEQPAATIADRVNLFFRNTLVRHGSGERPDVLDSSVWADGTLAAQVTSNGSSQLVSPASPSWQDPSSQINDLCISNMNKDRTFLRKENGCGGDRSEAFSPRGRPVFGDAKVLPRSRSLNLRTDSREFSWSSYGKVYSEPVLKPESDTTDGKYHKHAVDGAAPSDESASKAHLSGESGREAELSNKSLKFGSSSFNRLGSLVWQPFRLDGVFPVESQMVGIEEGNDASKPNLTGDYDTHFKNLMYAHECLVPQENLVSPVLIPYPGALQPPFQGRQPWNAYGRRNVQPYANGVNGGIPRAPFPPGIHMASPSMLPGPFRIDDSSKARGTGTYFPNLNYQSYRERPPSTGRGRYYAHPPHQGVRRRNVHTDMPAEEDINEHHPQNIVPLVVDHPSPAVPEVLLANHPPGTVSGGLAVPQAPENALTFGTVVLNVSEPPLQELGSTLNSSDCDLPLSGSPSLAPGPSVSSSPIGGASQPYRLKDEGDFPPLTS